jgi:hypothetical protein
VPLTLHPLEKNTSLQQAVTAELPFVPRVEYPNRGAVPVGSGAVAGAGCWLCSRTLTTSSGVTSRDVINAPEMAEMDFWIVEMLLPTF